jgi:hypothetical protein
MSRTAILSGTAPAHRAGLAALLVLGLACRDDVQLPSAPAEEPAESAAAPLAPEAGLPAVLDTRSRLPGLVFASFGMGNESLDKVHTGWMAGGALDPKNILSKLSGARARGGRVVIKLSMGRDRYVKNADGTFSLTKWKSLVSRFKSVNLGPYIADGTIIGHYLIDEPHRAQRWGGRAISHTTLEEMAKFSKELWPQMTTIVRVAPSWLASAPFSLKYVDAGWTQYRASHGDAAKWVASETRAAERAGLGLVVGMNVLDGGDGSSRQRGYTRSKWAMSASEIRKYGSAMLGSQRACGFFNWTHDSDFYNRSDIRSAMAEVSSKARSHARTSCRQ